MNRLHIALIGYGRMGKIIHTLAESRGHTIALIIDKQDDERWKEFDWSTIDVAIEFTAPNQAAGNVRRLLKQGVPIVSGTTGWTDELEMVKQEIEVSKRGVLLWASNFSIGVNLFFTISRELSRIMQYVKSYSPSITEIHHIHKLDAPSGTAITLAEEVINSAPQQFKDWHLHTGDITMPNDSLSIQAIREGEVPGTHTLSYTSSRDKIELRHEAYGREGFAEGAIVAAEFLVGRCGYFTMKDLMNALLEQEKASCQ